MDPRQFSAVPPTVREQEAERLRLEQANFDLKMQVFHLKDRLQRLGNPAEDDEIRQENLQQRQLLEELQLDLEHKNLCLQKATNLIQALKAQMDENGVTPGDVRGLRDELQETQRWLRDAQEDHEKVADNMQTKISQLQKKLAQKDTELAVARDKLTKAQREKDDLEAQVRKAKSDADLVQQQLYRLHQSVGSNSDEITRLRVENEMLRIEVEERADEHAAYELKTEGVLQAKDNAIADLSRTLEELKAEATAAETSHRQQIKTLTEEHETQVRALKLELMKLSDEHEQLVPLKAKVAELSQTSHLVATAKTDLEGLRGDNHRLQTEIITLQAQLSQAAKQLQEAKEDGSKLRFQLENLSAQFEQAKTSLDRAVQKTAEQQAEIQQLDILNQQLSEQLAEAKAFEQAANERTSQADKQLSVLQRQCDRLAVEKSVLERDLGKTDAEHAKLQAKIDKLEQDLQQALHEVHVRDDKIVQLTSSNAMLEVTCSSATEAAKRFEIQQQELAACKEKLVEVTTLRELMKIAQTAQGAAEARSKDLQAKLEEQSTQFDRLRKTSWEYQQQVLAQQAHVASLEKRLDAERTQFRQQETALTECRRKIAVVDDLLQSGDVRVVSAETLRSVEFAVAAIHEWHGHLDKLLCTQSAQPPARIADEPRLIAANLSFDTFDGIDALSEAIPHGDEAHSELLEVLPALIDDIDRKLVQVGQLRQEFYDQYNRLTSKWERMHAELVPRLQSLDMKIVVLAERHHADGVIRTHHNNTLAEVEARHKRLMDDMSDELRVVAGEASGAKERLLHVQQQLQRSASQTAELQSRCESLQRELATTKRNLEERNEHMQQISKHYGSIQQAVADLREQLQNSRDQVERLSESNRELTLELENQATQFESELQKSESLATEKTALLSAVHKLTEQIEARETMLAEHQEYIQTLKQKLERLKGRQRFGSELERSSTSRTSPLRQPGHVHTPINIERKEANGMVDYDDSGIHQPHMANAATERRPFHDMVSPRASKAAELSARRADRMERLTRMGEDLQKLGAQLDNYLSRTDVVPPSAAHEFTPTTPANMERPDLHSIGFGSSRARISRWANTQS